MRKYLIQGACYHCMPPIKLQIRRHAGQKYDSDYCFVERCYLYRVSQKRSAKESFWEKTNSQIKSGLFLAGSIKANLTSPVCLFMYLSTSIHLSIISYHNCWL